MTRIAAAAFACALAIIPTRTVAQGLTYCAADQTYRVACAGSIQRTSGAPRASRARSSQSYDPDVRILGGRPPGCPHRYCGCGLRKHLGIADTRLNLAWNWAKLFPRVSARPGAAAVRRGHVMLLKQHVGGNVWRVRDYNSGNGLSRIHNRSVAGFIFVDPSQRVASR